MALQSGGEGEKGEATSKSEPSVLKYHCVTSDASPLFFIFILPPPLVWGSFHPRATLGRLRTSPRAKLARLFLIHGACRRLRSHKGPHTNHNLQMLHPKDEVQTRQLQCGRSLRSELPNR